MKRRFLMWMTIICILVVGVSVTNVTREFVASHGVETTAFVNAAGVRSWTAPVESEPEMEQYAAEVPRMAAELYIEETVQAAYSGDSAIPEVISEVGAGAAEVPAMAAYSAVLTSDDEAAAPKSPLEGAEAEPETVPETVKSPLDPMVGGKSGALEAQTEDVTHSAEDFFDRFAQAEENAVKIWNNASQDNTSLYQTAAEQERILWEYERTQVYNFIRSQMTEKEAEELKILEMEWMKERDYYAEKKAARSSGRQAQTQNPEYIKAIAEKTKERCYWLVSEYEALMGDKEEPND